MKKFIALTAKKQNQGILIEWPVFNMAGSNYLVSNDAKMLAKELRAVAEAIDLALKE